jgi:hypothetical protein
VRRGRAVPRLRRLDGAGQRRFAVTSAAGVNPAWAAFAGAAVLAGRALARRTVAPAALARAADPPFLLFVLVLLPLAAPSGAGAVLAVLLGVNIGPNLTYTGSLATLLWRRVARSTVTETDTRVRSVFIWVCEGTWRATVDAALDLAPAGARFTLLHVTLAEVPDAVHGAYTGLLGRAGRSRRLPGSAGVAGVPARGGHHSPAATSPFPPGR